MTPTWRVQARIEYGMESELHSVDSDLIDENISQLNIDQYNNNKRYQSISLKIYIKNRGDKKEKRKIKRE